MMLEIQRQEAHVLMVVLMREQAREKPAEYEPSEWAMYCLDVARLRSKVAGIVGAFEEQYQSHYPESK